MTTRTLFPVALLCLSGCMTMLSERSAPVAIASTPSGAALVGDGRALRTPASLFLRRGRDHTFFLEAEGFRRERVVIESRHSPWRWAFSIVLNFAAWGWWSIGIGAVVGVAVDFSAGALEDFHPATVERRLAPAEKPPPPRVYEARREAPRPHRRFSCRPDKETGASPPNRRPS